MNRMDWNLLTYHSPYWRISSRKGRVGIWKDILSGFEENDFFHTCQVSHMQPLLHIIVQGSQPLEGMSDDHHPQAVWRHKYLRACPVFGPYPPSLTIGFIQMARHCPRKCHRANLWNHIRLLKIISRNIKKWNLEFIEWKLSSFAFVGKLKTTNLLWSTEHDRPFEVF